MRWSKQKLASLLLSVIAVLAESRPVLIKKPESTTNTMPSKNAPDARMRLKPLKSGLKTGLGCFSV